MRRIAVRLPSSRGGILTGRRVSLDVGLGVFTCIPLVTRYGTRPFYVGPPTSRDSWVVGRKIASIPSAFPLKGAPQALGNKPSPVPLNWEGQLLPGG